MILVVLVLRSSNSGSSATTSATSTTTTTTTSSIATWGPYHLGGAVDTQHDNIYRNIEILSGQSSKSQSPALLFQPMCILPSGKKKLTARGKQHTPAIFFGRGAPWSLVSFLNLPYYLKASGPT